MARTSRSRLNDVRNPQLLHSLMRETEFQMAHDGQARPENGNKPQRLPAVTFNTAFGTLMVLLLVALFLLAIGSMRMVPLGGL